VRRILLPVRLILVQVAIKSGWRRSPGANWQPNRGIPLDLNWIENVRVNTSAVERRAQTLVTRRTVKKDWQIAWLLRAITCMDLTTLSGDDTDERVRRLCAKGRNRFGKIW